MAPARPVPDLQCEESFRSAACKTLWTRFEELMSFRAAALAGIDPEGVHDMRVASRRLRAAIELYRDVFPTRGLKPLLREVKQIADTLGSVRDLDVMLQNVRNDLGGRPSGERLVLRDMIAEMEAERILARSILHDVLNDLDGNDFARRFLLFIARETA